MKSLVDSKLIWCLELAKTTQNLPQTQILFIIYELTWPSVWSTLALKLARILKTKGQLISKCPFGVKTSSKKPTKLFLDFCPEILCTFLGASWMLFEASCRLPYSWYYLLSPQEAEKASRKPPGNHKKVRAEIQK